MPPPRYLSPSSRAVVVSGALGALAAPMTARADDFAASVGFHLNVSLGGEGARAGVGLDLRAAWLAFGEEELCDPKPQGGVGVFLQSTWMFGPVRYAIGIHGGHDIGDDAPYPSWDLELGWTYRTQAQGRPAGQGLHIGVLGAGAFADASARFVLTFADNGTVIPEGILGVGLRYPGPFGASTVECVEGRPLRLAGRAVRPGVVVAGPCRRRHHLDPTTRAALAHGWLEAARDEAASVPAFVHLAADLTRLGAPPALARRALASARDEVGHARRCATIASRLAGVRLAPAPLPPLPKPSPDLASMTHDALVDGCIGEGAAAVRAAAALRTTRDPMTREALAAIAVEEARHAELAWDVVAFAAARPGLRSMIEETLASLDAPRAEPPAPAEADPAWSDHGRLPSATRAELLARTRDAVRPRVRRLLDHAASSRAHTP